MRRLPRLRRQHPLFNSLPASHVSGSSLCIASSGYRQEFSTTPRNREISDRLQSIRNKIWGGNAPGPKDPYAPHQINEDPQKQHPNRRSRGAAAASENPEGMEDWQAEAENARQVPIETALGLPPRIRGTPRPEDITDPSYAPAESGEGLEEVGGWDGWWDNENNWDASMDFVGFGPREKVHNPAALEILARMALVEALAVRQTAGARADEVLTGLWERGTREALTKSVAVGVRVDEGGTASLDGDLDSVVAALEWRAPPGEQEASTPVVRESLVTPDEAREFLKTWDASWKQVSLEDARLKFAVTKRILRLTGQVIPDSKLSSISTMEDLLRILVKPPKPKKLNEEIGLRGDLQKLANVKVYPRRVTPIDKEKTVGRWKVIVEELEKRGLPVTGTGKYGPSVEKKWVSGRH